jgi:DNA-binding beta-propeller fold protein YncE
VKAGNGAVGAIAITPDGTRVYLTKQARDNVAVIRTAVTNTVNVGKILWLGEMRRQGRTAIPCTA